MIYSDSRRTFSEGTTTCPYIYQTTAALSLLSSDLTVTPFSPAKSPLPCSFAPQTSVTQVHRFPTSNPALSICLINSHALRSRTSTHLLTIATKVPLRGTQP